MNPISANGSAARRDPEQPPTNPAPPSRSAASAGKSPVAPSPVGEHTEAESALDAGLGIELNAAVQGLVARSESRNAPSGVRAGPAIKVGGVLPKPSVHVDSRAGAADGVTRTKVQVGYAAHPVVSDPKRLSTEVNLGLDIHPGPTTITYRAGANRTGSDAYVPSRSLEQHEQAHFAVAAAFWKTEHLQEVLRQVAVPTQLSLPGAVPLAKAQAIGREYDRAIAHYFASYANYLQDRALHPEAMAAHDPHYPAKLQVPQFVDPRDHAVKTPTASDLDAFYAKVIRGIPNISPGPVP